MKAKMFKLGTLGFLAGAVLAACGLNLGELTRVTGSGQVVTETRNVSGFDGLIIVGTGKAPVRVSAGGGQPAQGEQQ